MTESCKQFLDFFTDQVDYPEIGQGVILPYGILWAYVSSTFLNGMINYAGYVQRAYVLGRYLKWSDRDDDDPMIVNVQDPPYSAQWVNKKVDTKGEIFDLVTKEGATYHSNLHVFRDDVLVLTRHADGVYWFFWFDCDASDCSIGRFVTETPVEQVIGLFDEYVTEISDPNIDTPRLLPNHFFQGRISF